VLLVQYILDQVVKVDHFWDYWFQENRRHHQRYPCERGYTPRSDQRSM